MTQNNLYQYGDIIVDESHYLAIMKLAKLLYRLKILDDAMTLQLAMEFRPFFV